MRGSLYMPFLILLKFLWWILLMILKDTYIFFSLKKIYFDPQKFLKCVMAQYCSQIDIFLHLIISVHWTSAKVILVIIILALVVKVNNVINLMADLQCNLAGFGKLSRGKWKSAISETSWIHALRVSHNYRG